MGGSMKTTANLLDEVALRHEHLDEVGAVGFTDEGWVAIRGGKVRDGVGLYRIRDYGAHESRYDNAGEKGRGMRGSGLRVAVVLGVWRGRHHGPKWRQAQRFV
jgi:hypothetical protein